MQEGLTSTQISANVWILQGVTQFSTELIAVLYRISMSALSFWVLTAAKKHFANEHEQKHDLDAK